MPVHAVTVAVVTVVVVASGIIGCRDGVTRSKDSGE
jgi:hypothetical protein